MALRLLIDACLTPAIVPSLAVAFEQRVDALHIDRIAPPGISDVEVFALAVRERRIVVTANSRDFLDIIRQRRPDHHGLILVADQNTRERQIAAVMRIVDGILAEAGLSCVGRVFTWRRTTNRMVWRSLP